MPDPTPARASALDGAVRPGRHGRATSAPGVSVSEARAPGLALVTARRGGAAGLAEVVRASFSLDLPPAGRWAAGPDLAFVCCGPEQWLACRAGDPADGMEALLAPLAAHAAIVDQGHARTLLRVGGPRVREALAKGVAVDLDPRACRPGDAAATLVAHVPVLLWQIDEAPNYAFAIPRGFALDFWHWLAASSAEFGLEVAGGDGEVAS